MKTDVSRSTVTLHAVELLDNDGEWARLVGTENSDYVTVYRDYESIQATMPSREFRIVEVVTETTISATPVWPFEWTEGGCHYNGLTDHDAHVTHERRGQYCRGNGPFMADEDWRPKPTLTSMGISPGQASPL